MWEGSIYHNSLITKPLLLHIGFNAYCTILEKDNNTKANYIKMSIYLDFLRCLELAPDLTVRHGHKIFWMKIMHLLVSTCFVLCTQDDTTSVKKLII